jgi:hypothetical protein
MKTDEKRPACDEKLQQLRRELLERIVQNEARRRTEQNTGLAVRKQVQTA